MLQVGQELTSKTNPNKKYEVKEVGEKKAVLIDLKTADEKELKIRTIERNYIFEKADAQPAEETEEKVEVQDEDKPEDNKEVKTERTSRRTSRRRIQKDNVEEEKEDSSEEEKEDNIEDKKVEETLKSKKAKKSDNEKAEDEAKAEKGKKEKAQRDKVVKSIMKYDEKYRPEIIEEELAEKELKELKEIEKEVKAEWRKDNPVKRGRKAQDFSDLDEELYTKTVTSEETEDGDIIRTETYIGKTADWKFIRHTKNNSFNKAEFEINGEGVKLSSPSKSRVSKRLVEELELDGLKLK